MQVSLTVPVSIVVHGGRVVQGVQGMKCVRLLEHWDREFESNSRHGCLSVIGSGLGTS
jgi:hypothetical protein